MDDEIDIEEHDILEHPQVKAVFPDLSKIRIHLHASEALFLDEAPTEKENLLEERPDYEDNDTTEDDLSKTAPEYENEERNYENGNSEDKIFVRENVIEESHLISDSETDDLPLPPMTGSQQNIFNDNIQIISKENHEFHNAVNTLFNESEEGMAEDYEDKAIAKPNEHDFEVHRSIPELGENVLQISDDELDSQELAEERDGLIKYSSESIIPLFEDAPELNQYNEEDSEINNELHEINAEDDNGCSDQILVSDVEYTGKNPELNDEIIEEYNEGPFINVDMPIQDNVDSKYLSDPELEEYRQMRIKKEIEFELENLTDFDGPLPDEAFNDDDLPPEDIYHFKNKIILGSKPSPLVQGDVGTIDNKSYLVVLLEDWSVYLSRSQTYCKDCKTLFTTPNALDAHRMIAHSLLTPIVTNRAIKSTALSSVNVARKSTVNKKTGCKRLSDSTYCNHCNVTFKDHTALIKHLYKLLPVKQHACHLCDATFQNQSDLVNHNSEHIKLEQPRKYIKAKKNNDNPILRKMLNKKTNSDALKHCNPVELKLAEVQNVNIKQTVDIKKEPTTSQCKYKCLVCSDVFLSYSAARGHRAAHPQTPVNDILKRVLTKRGHPNSCKDKLTYEEPNKKVKKKSEKPLQLIPTGALFQCSKCDINFLTSVAGQSHVTANKCNYKNSWCCPTCKKNLRSIDKTCHTRQHELSTKIKIYKITKNIYEKTLCKCLNCNVYFEYIPLRMHLRKCGKLPTAKCKTCNILFPNHKLADHMRKHELMKWKKKDFILVDYAVVKNKLKAVSKTCKSIRRTNPLLAKNLKQEPKIKIKAEPGTTKSKSKIVNKLKFEREKLKMYFCKHCKCSMFMRNLHRSNRIHLSKQCVKGRYMYTSNCKHCGLKVFRKTRKSHERLHVIKKLTLDDFAFYDFATLKPITLPMPQYPCCDKCKIHFLNKTMIRNHICGEDYDNCEVCGDKFENSALEIHLAIHRKLSATHKAPKAPSHPKIIPELMMKYESLNAIWNILFICGKCELVTDVYNKAVEHSQAHLNKDSPSNTIKCYICNLKFDESCWSKHSELHSRMNLNNKDFKILKYVPNNLLDESWFQMFETLPEQEIRQIIDRSVFGSERSLKMRLVKDGLPEFTVYCCSNCHVSYDNNEILDHVKSRCMSSKHVCRDCGVTFNSSATLQFHDLLHQKGIKKEEFRIVHFVKSDDAKTTFKFKEPIKKANQVVSKKTEIKIDKKVTKKSVQYVLYKCKECTSCLQRKINQNYHTCAPEHHLIYCKLCKQNFSFRQMGVHRAKHKNHHDFRAKNINIISFEPMPEGEDKPRYSAKNVSKSKTSKRAKSNHVDSTRVPIKPTSIDDSLIESERCQSPRCSSANSNYSLDLSTVRGTALANSKQCDTRASRDSSDADQTENKKTAKLYKCDCGLHYTSSRSIEKHIETCDSSDDISKEHCSKCGLLFPTDILVSHLCKHHSQDTALTVEAVHKRGGAAPTCAQKRTSTAVADGIKLYKCSECNVYFLNQSSCYKHTSKHVPLDPKEYIECKMCCFQFRILSLHIHMRKHHEKEFNLEKVLVEEYQPSVGKRAPRIDIYFANDRFQNVQVSSTND